MITIIFKYYLEIALAGSVALGSNLYKKLKIQIQANHNGTKALLRTHLVNQYHEYQKQGKIEIYQRQDFQSLYKEYKKFGEDEDIDNLFERILELEINM